VDERLQTGQNPIEVAIPAIPQTFADAHGKSVAVGYVGDERVLGGPYPVLGIESCPEPEGPPECPPGTHEHSESSHLQGRMPNRPLLPRTARAFHSR
jgi:hypothetical protein